MGSDSIKAILETLSPSELKLLLKIHEKSHPEFGADVREVGLKKNDSFVSEMIKTGILEVAYSSTKYFQVKLNIDPNIVKEIYEQKTRPIDPTLVRTLLDKYVVGMQDIKDLVVKAIDQNVWLLLVGRPATGKSMILDALKRLPRTMYFHGVSVKKADILGVMSEQEIEVVLIDEIDKIHNMIIDALTELWDYVKYNNANLTVIGTANELYKLSDWVRSRFYVVEVPELDVDTVVEVVRRETGFDDREIIEKIWNRWRDIRRVVYEIKLKYL